MWVFLVVRGDPNIQALPPVIAVVHALVARGGVLTDGRGEWAVACRGRTNHGRHATEPNRHRQHYHPCGIDYRIIPRFESHNACGTSGLWSLEIEPASSPYRLHFCYCRRYLSMNSLGTKARWTDLMVVRVDIGHGDRSKTARCLFVEILPCKLKSLGPYSTDTKEFSSEEKCAIFRTIRLDVYRLVAGRFE